jgi:hypothetical protein
MGDEQRIRITFDEFFKRSSKSFFEKEGFRVETEVEIFHLPKRLDVLVVKNSLTHFPPSTTRKKMRVLRDRIFLQSVSLYFIIIFGKKTISSVSSPSPIPWKSMISGILFSISLVSSTETKMPI